MRRDARRMISRSRSDARRTSGDGGFEPSWHPTTRHRPRAAEDEAATTSPSERRSSAGDSDGDASEDVDDGAATRRSPRTTPRLRPTTARRRRTAARRAPAIRCSMRVSAWRRTSARRVRATCASIRSTRVSRTSAASRCVTARKRPGCAGTECAEPCGAVIEMYGGYFGESATLALELSECLEPRVRSASEPATRALAEQRAPLEQGERDPAAGRARAVAFRARPCGSPLLSWSGVRHRARRVHHHRRRRADAVHAQGAARHHPHVHEVLGLAAGNRGRLQRRDHERGGARRDQEGDQGRQGRAEEGRGRRPPRAHEGARRDAEGPEQAHQDREGLRAGPRTGRRPSTNAGTSGATPTPAGTRRRCRGPDAAHSDTAPAAGRRRPSRAPGDPRPRQSPSRR